MLGEPRLRWRTKRFRGNVSVPVLIAGDEVLTDSLAIAQYADRMGQGAPLFGHAGMDPLVELADRGLSAARAAGLPKVLDAPDALRELVPRGVSKVLGRGLSAKVAAFGVRRTMRKYGVDREPAAAAKALRGCLEATEAALAAGGGDYVVGTFSYADIALAQVVNQSLPTDAMGKLRLSDAYREVCFSDELAERFSGLMSWRDGLIAKHR